MILKFWRNKGKFDDHIEKYDFISTNLRVLYLGY